MRDRIAASAREKLGQVDKEKQLQAERKKRAAMFINMLKGSNTDGGGAQTNDKGWFKLSFICFKYDIFYNSKKFSGI